MEKVTIKFIAELKSHNIKSNGVEETTLFVDNIEPEDMFSIQAYMNQACEVYVANPDDERENARMSPMSTIDACNIKSLAEITLKINTRDTVELDAIELLREHKDCVVVTVIFGEE